MNIELSTESVAALLIAGRVQVNLINIEMLRCQMVKDLISLEILKKQKAELYSALTQLWGERTYDIHRAHDDALQSPFGEAGS